jgi:hypothetical protein
VSDITVFRVNAFHADRYYHDSMIRSALWAADLWSKHTDRYAVMAADYWRNVAIGWASR